MFFRKSLQERSLVLEQSAGAAQTAAEKPKLAVFVAHGMGQHIPFETMDVVATGIAKAVAKRHTGKVSTVSVATVQVNSVRMQRIEIDTLDINGDPVEIHLYEGYWAPITEGQVSLTDVVSFLLRGALNGLRNTGAEFQRWLFGRYVGFGRQKTGFALLATLLVVLTLILFNALIVGMAATKVMAAAWGETQEVGSTPRFDALTTLAGLFSVLTFVIGGALSVATIAGMPAGHVARSIWKRMNTVLAAGFWVWVVATIALGLTAVVVLGSERTAEAVTLPFFAEHWLIVWGLLLFVSYFLRQIMVQFPGDVAAYISTHTLDRFNEIRARIKERTLSYLTAVYEIHQYQGVAVVGHSLGSVIAYDTLNGLLANEELQKKGLDVLGRTRLLLTLGCPLDKTAFIFATQGAKTTTAREALSASLQPLITRYNPYRRIKWINIYAPRDICSGELNFYDDKTNPQHSDKWVINLIDQDALVPLGSHVEYWKNDLLYDKLYENLAVDRASLPRSTSFPELGRQRVA